MAKRKSELEDEQLGGPRYGTTGLNTRSTDRYDDVM